MVARLALQKGDANQNFSTDFVPESQDRVMGISAMTPQRSNGVEMEELHRASTIDGAAV